MKVFFTLFLALFTLNASAEESIVNAASESSSRFNWNSLLEKSELSYAALLTGPSTKYLDGNKDGRGTNLTLRNYVSASFEFAKNWEAETGVEFRRYFRPVDPKKPGRSDFEWRDPFVSVDRKNIVKTDRFSLAAKLRYFIPATAYNKSNVKKEYDSGNGTIGTRITPSWKLGDFFVSCYGEFNYRFDENAPKVRQDYYVKAKPFVSYKFARNWSAKVEYSTGDLNHRTNGKWTKFNDPAIGQNVYTGVTWTATKKLSISPSLGWGPGSLQLRDTEVSVFASYYIL
jgi:hypothetical protein